MARKGRNKKVKKKIFNKKKFRNVYCPQCALCDRRATPDFCYNTIYKSNPQIFTTEVFPNLLVLGEWLTEAGNYAAATSLEDFSDVFCVSGVCTNGIPMKVKDCQSHDKCYSKFMDQVRLIESKAQIKKRKKEKKRRKVYEAYPTYFCRNNEKFKIKVNKILYGDNDNKQDKDKELSSSSSGDTDRPATDRES